MKKIVFLLFVFTIASALPLSDDEEEDNEQLEEDNDELGWRMPQLNGSDEWMSVEELQILRDSLANAENNTDDIKFYIYPNNYTEQEIFLGNVDSMQNSNFDGTIPTRIIIHGWRDDKDGELNSKLRSAFLSTGAFNVIFVDWSSLGGTIIYPIAAINVEKAGKTVANFIDFLHIAGGMSFDSLLVAAHSLGAHVAGFAGKNVEQGQILQITGLDPAAPGFIYSNPSDRLNASDAFYVESIQTSGGRAGFKKPIGKATFYPNGGLVQPGCGFDLLGGCDHLRSYEYYAEAIRKNNFPTIRCRNYGAALVGLCGSIYSGINMGAPNNYAEAEGVFYVPVNERPPYGTA